MLEKEIENENKSNNNSSENSSSKSLKNSSKNEKIFYHKLNELKLNNLNPEKEIILNREKIILLTFDIEMKSKFLESSENKERIKKFSENLKNFDIICLQNISSSFEDNNFSLIEIAAKNGFFFFSNSNSVDFFSSYFYENGQIILSRFSIEKICFIPFENNIFKDSIEQKGILYSKIKIKNNFLNVINVNLQSNEFNDEKIKNQNEIVKIINDCKKIRKNQILLIIKFIKEVLFENSENFKEGDLIILCGNFNIDSNNYNFINENINEYDEIIDLFRNNKINIKNVSGTKNLTFGFEKKFTNKNFIDSNECVDFIFEISKENFESNFEIKCDFDNSTVKFEFNNENLSSHNGISCEINYKGKIDDFTEKYNEKEELID